MIDMMYFGYEVICVQAKDPAWGTFNCNECKKPVSRVLIRTPDRRIWLPCQPLGLKVTRKSDIISGWNPFVHPCAGKILEEQLNRAVQQLK